MKKNIIVVGRRGVPAKRKSTIINCQGTGYQSI